MFENIQAFPVSLIYFVDFYYFKPKKDRNDFVNSFMFSVIDGRKLNAAKGPTQARVISIEFLE